MTAYITITDVETDPEAPLTSELAKKWRDNPIAISEGSSGAPKIYGAAMFGPAAGAVVQRKCIVTGNEVASSSSTSSVIVNVPQTYFTALVGCTVRVNITMTSSGNVGETRLYKNNAIIQTWAASITDGTLDVALLAGDSLGVNLRAVGTSGGSTGSVTLSKFDYQFDQRSVVMT